VTYIDILNHYWDKAPFQDGYKPAHSVLYFSILHLINKNYWKETRIDYDRLIALCGLSKQTYLESRKWLATNKWIGLTEGKNSYQSASFSLGVEVRKLTGKTPSINTATPPSTLPASLPINRQEDIKDNKTNTTPPPKADALDLSSFGEFRPILEKWLKYKKGKNQKYKDQDSLEALYKKLVRFSGNSVQVAEQIIEDAMANNYSGFFEPKQNSGTAKNGTATGPKEPNTVRYHRTGFPNNVHQISLLLWKDLVESALPGTWTEISRVYHPKDNG